MIRVNFPMNHKDLPKIGIYYAYGYLSIKFVYKPVGNLFYYTTITNIFRRAILKSQIGFISNWYSQAP